MPRLSDVLFLLPLLACAADPTTNLKIEATIPAATKPLDGHLIVLLACGGKMRQ